VLSKAKPEDRSGSKVAIITHASFREFLFREPGEF
jgi:hypothetical protein